MPEIAASLGLGLVMQYILHDNRLLAVVMGGVFLIVAAGLTLLVQTSPIDGLTNEIETIQTDGETTPKLTPNTSLNEQKS